MGVGQHDPCGVDSEELDAAVGQDVQELDHVELVDQRVREVDERSGQLPEIRHDNASTIWAPRAPPRRTDSTVSLET